MFITVSLYKCGLACWGMAAEKTGIDRLQCQDNTFTKNTSPGSQGPAPFQNSLRNLLLGQKCKGVSVGSLQSLASIRDENRTKQQHHHPCHRPASAQKRTERKWLHAKPSRTKMEATKGWRRGT